MQNPEPLWLRGFVGSVYRDGAWEPLSNREYYQQSQLFYWLSSGCFSGLRQLSQVSGLLGEEREQAAVTIRNIGASRQYLYLPYELAESIPEGTKNWSDSFLTSDRLRGAGEYRIKYRCRRGGQGHLTRQESRALFGAGKPETKG